MPVNKVMAVFSWLTKLRVFHLLSCLHGSYSLDSEASFLRFGVFSVPVFSAYMQHTSLVSRASILYHALGHEPPFKRMIHFIDHFLPTSFPRFGRIGGTTLVITDLSAENDCFPER